jgi:hypothetical protein
MLVAKKGNGGKNLIEVTSPVIPGLAIASSKRREKSGDGNVQSGEVKGEPPRRRLSVVPPLPAGDDVVLVSSNSLQWDGTSCDTLRCSLSRIRTAQPGWIGVEIGPEIGAFKQRGGASEKFNSCSGSSVLSSMLNASSPGLNVYGSTS